MLEAGSLSYCSLYQAGEQPRGILRLTMTHAISTIRLDIFFFSIWTNRPAGDFVVFT